MDDEQRLPRRVTDIAVLNAGAGDLSGVNTITAMAVLAPGRSRGAPDHSH